MKVLVSYVLKTLGRVLVFLNLEISFVNVEHTEKK